VADSALAQINNILIDIRSMVTEAANTGAMNTAMLEALQLQVDASLDTIDRIASSTQFIDQKLLDGSLDFVTYGVDKSKVDFLQINQANFMGRIEKDIAVKILQQAKQATLYYRQVGVAESVNLSVGGKLGYTTLPIAQGADLQSIVDAVNLVSDSTGVEAKLETRATNGMIAVSSVGENNDIILTASEAGSLGGNFVVKYTAPREGNDKLTLNYTPGRGNEPNCIEIVLQTKPSVGNQTPEVLTTAAQVVELINTSDLLRDAKGNGMVVASLPDCTSGMGTVTPFEEYAYCGCVVMGNALQFLGPIHSPNITFVAEPGQSLSIGYSTAPTYGNGEAIVQGLDPGT
jgi:flagellin-like hook-associated protein FlgL